MKRHFSLAIALMLTVAAWAGAKIDFKNTSHDFGNIPQRGGRVTCEYKFTNTGDAPLVIISVSNGGCGCTKPTFPQQPIKPGESGVISITFDPTGRRGELNRTVQVKTNASKKTKKLKFTGVVVPPAE